MGIAVSKYFALFFEISFWKNTMNPNMDYYGIVERCASNLENFQIANGKAEHARHIIKLFFDVAANKVRLYSGNLTETTPSGVDVYRLDKLIQSAIRFLRLPDAKLQILLQHELDKGPNHSLLTAIREKGLLDKVEIRQIDSSDSLATKGMHFMTVDDRSYRLETDDCNTLAIANFWDPKLAKRLGKVFDTVFIRNKVLSIV